MRSEHVLFDKTFLEKLMFNDQHGVKICPPKHKSDRNVLGILSAQKLLLHGRLLQVGG